MQTILAKEYGIKNLEDLKKAISDENLLDIGIFTVPAGKEKETA